MALPTIPAQYHKYFPAGFTGIAILTWLICVITAFAGNTYIGGIPYPYFSDTGRDPPAYYVFAIGFTIASGFLVASGWFNYRWMTSLIDASLEANTNSEETVKCARSNAVACFVFTVIGCPTLLCTGVFDTARNASVHLYSSYVAILMITLFFVVNTVAFNQLRKLGVLSPVTTEPSFKAKLIISTIAIFAFIIYLPLGMAVNCPFVRLTVAKCIALPKPVSYCNVTVLNPDNPALTVLWDYSPCPDTNLLRTVTQHMFLVSAFCYFTTLYLDLKLGADAAGDGNPSGAAGDDAEAGVALSPRSV